jgi:hypothetical protein
MGAENSTSGFTRIDAFPTDPAASTDSDHDGVPDEWNPGRSAEDSTTNLTYLDAFLTDPAASKDTDSDLIPDEWNPGRSSEDSTTNLTYLDAFPTDPAVSKDTDGGRVPDEWNPGRSLLDSTTRLTNLYAFPTDPAASMDTDGDGHPDAWNPGNSQAHSTTGLTLDHHPTDATRWEKISAEQVTTEQFIIILLLIGVIIASIIGILVFFRLKAQPIEDVFIITNEGLLLAHKSKELRPDMDDDIFSSMLTAIQNFVKDSIKERSDYGIKKLDFGRSYVFIKQGKYVYLAVVLTGDMPANLDIKLDHTISKIENKYGHILKNWDGIADKVEGVQALLDELMK